MGIVLIALCVAISPDQAVDEAILDACPDYRYVWVNSASRLDFAIVDWTQNMTLNRASTQVPIRVLKSSRVARINLRELAPRDEDFRELCQLWELFDKDESTFQSVRFAPCKAYPAGDGKEYMYRWVRQDHLDNILELEALTGSKVPIVDLGFFIHHSLSTKDGGLYYQLRGVPSTQAEFLKKFAGVTEKDVENLRSDQRTAQFFSLVTGKPRRVDVLPGLGVRSDVSTGRCMITRDVEDNNKNVDEHPILNLLNEKYAATEIILEARTGFHIFALFNGQGVRQDDAPDEIAKDHTVPRPYTAILQPAIGCIRCHAEDPGDEGIKPAQNDVLKLAKKGKYSFFDGDVDTLDRLRGLYSGDLKKTFRRMRDDYSDAIVFLGTRHKLPERLTVTQASQHVSDVYKNYKYTRITPKLFLEGLGLEIKGDKHKNVFNRLFPDLPPYEKDDARILALKSDLTISRIEYEQIYADAYRSIKSHESLDFSTVPLDKHDDDPFGE
jgi:hypothetical protein